MIPGIMFSKIGFLFDLDGVLLDSESEYTKIWDRINLEFPSGCENLSTVIKGTTLEKILQDYYPDSEIRIKVEKRLHELENRMNYQYLPFAKEFLDLTKHYQIDCVLVTSSNNEKMNGVWSQLPELKQYFRYIVTGNQVKKSKPSPEGYLLAANKICKSIDNCVVFEDSLQGVLAGNNAGALVVGVAGTLPKEILAPYSHILVNNLGELSLDNLIQKLTIP